MTLTSNRRFVTVAGAAAAVALAGSVLAASPALAATPAQPYGTVTSPSGVVERQLPTTNSAKLGTLPYRAEVGLRCKVHGQNIDGNDLWYKLRNQVQGKDAWITARYVRNTGVVNFCPSSPRLSGEQLTPVQAAPLG